MCRQHGTAKLPPWELRVGRNLREYEGPVVIDGVGGIRISWIAGTREIIGLEIPATALEVESVD